MDAPGLHTEVIAMAQTGYTPILIYSSSTTTNAPSAGSLTNSTLGSELAINITDGKLFYKDNANAIQVIGWKVVPTTAGGTGLTSYTAGDTIYYATGTAFSKLAIGSSGYYMSSSGSAPQWSAPAALTKTDDTNVTLTLGGSASTALLNAASLTLGWTGQLAVSRGGTGQSTFTDGQLLIGNSTGNTLTKATLTAGAGISITNGSGAITIAGSGSLTASAPVTVTSNYTVVDGVTYIINNKSGSSLTVTLPTASSYTGRIITIQNYQAQTVISASSNVTPQGGGSAGTAILTNVAGNWATLVSDGTNWVIMSAAAFNNLLTE